MTDRMHLQTTTELEAACAVDDRALRSGQQTVGQWRIAPATREVVHARVPWYAIDLDRVSNRVDAVDTIVHISRKRGVFDDADVGALTHLFDRLGLL